MLNAARASLAGALAGEKTTTVLVKRADKGTSAVGGGTLDWSSPTTVATVTGRRQPTNREQLDRAGLQQLTDAWTWFLTDTNLTPETHRLYVGSVIYRVVSVERWENSHVEAITEVLDDGS